MIKLDLSLALRMAGAMIVAAALLMPFIQSARSVVAKVDLTVLKLDGPIETDYWRVTAQTHYKLPRLVRGSQASGCIHLFFDITSEGRFANPQIADQINGKLFEKELLASMQGWRWQPSESNADKRQAVRTQRILGFGPDQSIRSGCYAQRKIIAAE